MASHPVPAETVNSLPEQGEQVGAPQPSPSLPGPVLGQRSGLQSLPGGRRAGCWSNSSAGMKRSVLVHRSGRPYRNGRLRWVRLLRLLAGISRLETPIALGCSGWRSSLVVRHLMRGSGLELLHPCGSRRQTRAHTSLLLDKVPGSPTPVVLAPKSNRGRALSRALSFGHRIGRRVLSRSSGSSL